MMDVFQLLDNNPLLGHYWVKMALDTLEPIPIGCISGILWGKTSLPEEPDR
jgi:hypothetical protein